MAFDEVDASVVPDGRAEVTSGDAAVNALDRRSALGMTGSTAGRPWVASSEQSAGAEFLAGFSRLVVGRQGIGRRWVRFR
jgi:hypothetical protein